MKLVEKIDGLDDTSKKITQMDCIESFLVPILFVPNNNSGYGVKVKEVVVKVGDTVRANQLLATIQTEDSDLIEILSPAVGIITEVLTKNDRVRVGEVIAQMSVPIKSFVFPFVVPYINSLECIRENFVKMDEVVTVNQLLFTFKPEYGKLIEINSPAAGIITALPVENNQVTHGELFAEMSIQAQSFVLPLVVPYMQCFRGGYVREIFVKVGDTVTVNQLLITIEPDDRSGKIIKIFSPAVGAITALTCDLGDRVWSGNVISQIGVQVPYDSCETSPLYGVSKAVQKSCSDARDNNSMISNLERLAALKEKGFITDSEFEQQKRKLFE